MGDYIYNGKFGWNALIVGRARFGKTSFTQKLAINNFFSDLKKVEWVSYIDLEINREVEIQSWFSCKVEFHYPKDINSFDGLLEGFKLKS